MSQPLPDELTRRRALRRMKAVATGLLLLASVVYVVARWQEHAGAPVWVGYVRAAAEAGMVGALADWFAVTALFRRPLGLPIPHTAIIPTRKNEIGDSLGDFVGANFLAETVVRDRLRQAEVGARVGRWLARPDNAERLTSELSTALRGAVAVLRDDDVRVVLEQAVVRRLEEQPWGPPLGRLLGQVVAEGSHHRLVDLLCDRAYEWVRDNEDTLRRVVSERAPSWSPRFVDSMVGDRVYGEVLTFARAVRDDPNHRVRLMLDDFLTQFARDLREDPEAMARAERFKREVLAHPAVQGLAASLWSRAKEMLLSAAEDPSSELRTRVRGGIESLGERLATDPEMRDKAERWLETAVVHVVENYRHELTSLISDTVRRWDGVETARKVELQVGRDLQFIRINGTVVGALAGLAIHTFSHLVL
ncbi:DUF445 domain-containing protein [Actinoalloteichus sp. AHMU CJ021]|uniref:Uncharacterized membrane-anchored protein YjiN, DUF445 family n=2 Tax=Pseudonocardiaceae TaxID=2070 RepID=A0ABT1JMD0_ACTCY|nr:DUF445 domain-containing protein [Actinoalloteichus sp. AHMU CJ021]MCP2333283.1 Uncharacterized membrane-anchored protein YjiN, DUF445 family [Actinoalloteichus caeruleus DSM 43889]